MELIDRALLDIPSDDNEWEALVKFADDVASADIVEAIPKDQYEQRLKADMVAMLTEIQLEIEEKSIIDYDEALYDGGECVISISEINNIIQDKINELRGRRE